MAPLPIKSSEPLLGFASRYAREHNMRLPRFMRLTGIKIWNYASFEAAVSRLATMSGNSAEELVFHALRVEDGGRHRLLGELIDRRDAIRNAARYCPHCVVEDHSGGGPRPFSNVFCRAAWMHSRVGACPRHKIALVSITEQYASYATEDFTSALMDNWHEVIAAAEGATTFEVADYDRYFCDRLNGVPASHEVLDELPYEGALRLCDVLGAMITGKGRKARAKQSADEIRMIAKTGFDLLSTGYLGLRAFLEELDDRYNRADDESGGSKLYGKLYGFLHDNAETPGFTSLVKFVRDHAFSVHPLGPENNFPGHGGIRKFHSVRSAFLSYGIQPSTLRNLLAAEGLLDDEMTPARDLKISIPVDVMEAIIENWRDSVPMLFARERLATSPQVVRQFVAAGILSTKSEKSEHALKNLFSRKQIEGLIVRLESLASSDPDAVGMTPLQNCVPFMSFADQIKGILQSKIPLGILKLEGEPTTLEHLRVDTSVVKAVVGVGAPTGYVTAKYVTSRLVTVTDTVHRLESEGVFETVKYRSRNGLSVTGYSETSVKSFMKNYITFRKLARQKANWASTETRVAGIKPVFDFGGPERIYRRQDLKRA
ncbi:TniQ family protein [Rhizobium leguminosarum]|uniref:TniQ family protein n=1 Tax=Rhizobium leguminosarum TaxID=384 RepID=UPI001C94F6BF|nr:TniQ family protein [Rhizobium leguminosarum]MBY5646375.1 TniQ family protein [Rhizobium leguminosarum]